MSKGLIDILIEKIFDEKFRGWYGEKLTEKELKFANFLGKKGKILRNVYLPKDNGETSEVDVIYITQKGIVVIESKNYSGWIFGDENNRYWTAMLANKQKNKFYNPIMQNKTHIKWMQEFVGEDIPLFSVIAFSERCELKKTPPNSDKFYIIKRDCMYAVIKDIWENNPDILSPEDIEQLYIKLKALTKVHKSVKKEHIENIEKKYKQEKLKITQPVQPRDIPIQNDTPQSMENITPTEDINTEPTLQENNLICPRCGNTLVFRTAKKGANVGKGFYGCSNYPKCRYIQNIE